MNDLEETTGAVLLKGSTREVIKRHANTLIFLYRPKQDQNDLINSNSSQSLNDFDLEPDFDQNDQSNFDLETNSARPKRKAAIKEKAWLKDLIEDGLV